MIQAELSLDDQVSNALKDPRFARRELRFESSEGKITLTGKVSSFYQKQMAQEIVGRLDGVRHIDNQLEVCWS